MQSKSEGNSIILKLEKNENVQEKILEAAEKYGVSSGTILWAVGMIRDLEIGYFNGKEYEKEVFGDALEVVSFHGSIASNEPRLHIHVSGAQKNHSVIGGHMFSGSADPLLEVHILKLDETTLKRSLNEASGLKELTIE
jgi:predicted DNA-binding protein with PD1-like motif